MSNNYSGDNDSLNLNEKERNEKLIKEHDCLVNEPSLKFQQLVSIFENQESETKFKCKYYTFSYNLLVGIKFSNYKLLHE